MTPEEEAKIYNDYYDALNEQTEVLANELDCSFACAEDVQYLRTRSRWTPELEKELIRLHKEGNPPNICDWPSR